MKNPILEDPEVAARLDRIGVDAQRELKTFCAWLYEHARQKAETSWRQSKAPMAVYWNAVAAWSYHISRSIKIHSGQRP